MAELYAGACLVLPLGLCRVRVLAVALACEGGMTCVRIGGAILTLSDECAPFYYAGKRYSVSEQWGPFRCDRFGDPLKNQPVSGFACMQLQGAYEHYLNHIAGAGKMVAK